MKNGIAIIVLGILFFSNSYAQKLSDSVMVNTFAGSGANESRNGNLKDASFKNIHGMCFDINGNMYVTDYYNSKISGAWFPVGGATIHKITPGGVVSTFFSDIDLTMGTGICVDLFGNVYSSSVMQSVIHKITPAGVKSVYAGSSRWEAADGTGDQASFYNPAGICMDAFGNIYVADLKNNKIRKIAPGGKVTTVAGSGMKSSNDGTSLTASFDEPSSVCVDGAGNLYVGEYEGKKVRKITPDGMVTTLAGSGISGSSDGIGTAASFGKITGLTIDASGNLYVSDHDNKKIRRITPGGAVSTFAGGGKSSEGIGNVVSIEPFSICFDANNNLYVGDDLGHRIAKLTRFTPSPPEPNYLNLPASLCMGSTVNYEPAVSGSAAGLQLVKDSLNVSGARAICRNDSNVFILTKGDSILRYDLQGSLKQVYNNLPLFTNVSAIAADTGNRVYVVAKDNTYPSLTSVYRMDASGNWDFGFGSSGQTPAGVLNNVSGITIGPGGLVYVADTTSGYISSIDPNTAAVSNLPAPGNLQYSYDKPCGLAFDKFGRMYVADMGRKTILIRDASDNNYYPAFPKFDTLNLKVTSIDIDTVGLGAFYVSAPNWAAMMTKDMIGADTVVQIYDYKALGVNTGVSQAISNTNWGTGIPLTWIADASSNYVKRVAMYAFTITPSLPAGLSYNSITGQITGTPLTSSPLQTYTVSVTSSYGTNTKSFSFSVDPPASLNNVQGTVTSNVVKHGDGLKINYFEANNCTKMITIQDSPGGSNPGNVKVEQKVYSTIATFNSGKFVGRVTDISVQNTNSPARVKLYFTYTDIVNFNAGNGTDPDLSNDTTGGTMQVSVLQLHKDDKGILEQIKHNVTAKWITKDKVWDVDFPVTKFSTFYMGESTTINAFNCSSTGSSTMITACSKYKWGYKFLTQTGTYKDTLTNVIGCDSIVTLNLTVNNDFEISKDVSTPEVLYCNTTDADSYQWINCDNGTSFISGATANTYTATQDGNYSVIVSKNSCTDTAICVTVSNLSLATIVLDTKISDQPFIYPNPTQGTITIDLGNFWQNSDGLRITNMLGVEVYHTQKMQKTLTIDMKSMDKGIYILQIFSDNETIAQRIIIE